MTNIHKTRSLIIGGLTALMGMQGAYAAQIDSCADWNPCCFDYGLNPPPTCPTCCGCTWYGQLEYLYWKPFVEHAHPCTLITSDRINVGIPISQASSSHTTSRNKDFRFDWDSGFRVGLGYGFPCDKWGLALTWTHYRTDAFFSESGFGSFDTDEGFVKDVKMPIPGFISSDQTGLLIGFQTGSLAAKWNFQFNQVDLDFFRDFYVGCSLSLKPYVGLRALILKNTIDSYAQYQVADQDISNFGFPFNQSTFSQRLRSDLKSFGLKGGLESFWEVTCGLGVYGNVGASLIYANYETENKTQISGTTIDNGGLKVTGDVETPYWFQTLKMMSDLSIGIQWRQAINCNQNLVVIKAGWEHHMLLQGSQFQTITADRFTAVGGANAFSVQRAVANSGDISLYGFVFSVGFSF